MLNKFFKRAISQELCTSVVGTGELGRKILVLTRGETERLIQAANA